MFISSLKRMDWLINVSAATLALASLAIIASARPALFSQQLSWFVLAAAVIAIGAAVDWRPFLVSRRLMLGVYFFSVALLVITYFFAPEIRHTRSWLVFGPVQVQTSEFAKFGLIVFFSYFFARRHSGIAHWYNIAIPFVYFALPAALVLLQPDLGSTLILFGLWLSYLFMSGLRRRHLIIGLLLCSIAAAGGWHWFLKEYQKERVIGFFQPEYDPLGVNYNVIQSKISIGSAGWWGKGFRQGTQVQLGFLPEAATDFIFAAFTEEWGVAGAALLLAAFTALTLRIIIVGARSENSFSQLLCLGTAVVLLLHFVFNIGSTIGFLPVVGVPFPFFSYGGSSILTLALLIGIIQSIAIRSH